MSDDGRQDWHHAGISKIKENSGSRESRYVRVPDRLFREEDILILGHSVNWYLNETTGVLIVTHERLDRDDYQYTGRSTKFSEGDSRFGLTVPKPFYDQDRGVDGTVVQPDPVDRIQLEKDEVLHFVYHQEMADGDSKSCYVLTEGQFSKRFSDSDVWNGKLEQVPKFFS